MPGCSLRRLPLALALLHDGGMETSIACAPLGVTPPAVSPAAGGAKVGGAGSDLVRPFAGFASCFDFLRFADRRSDSRRSHCRIVSRPISIPISRRPPTSVSADSPAWANRSNSSRCGSSCAVAWLRGCRAWATAWASVVGREVMSGEWMGNDMGANAAQYVWWSGSARGAPRAHSKRKRLDVGVLPYFFVLFLLDESGFILGSLIGWFIWLVDFLDFVLGVSVELVPLSYWVHWFDVHFPGRVVLGFFGPSFAAGGGGC